AAICRDPDRTRSSTAPVFGSCRMRATSVAVKVIFGIRPKATGRSGRTGREWPRFLGGLFHSCVLEPGAQRPGSWWFGIVPPDFSNDRLSAPVLMPVSKAARLGDIPRGTAGGAAPLFLVSAARRLEPTLGRRFGPRSASCLQNRLQVGLHQPIGFLK